MKPFWHQLRHYVSVLFGRERRRDQLNEEMRCHIDLLVDEHIQNGMSRPEALRAARREFGSPALFQEKCQDTWGLRFLDDLMNDLRLAARQLKSQPAFSAVAILTLAFGIGANTAIFSFVHTLLLKPLPYPDAERVVKMWGTVAQGDHKRGSISIPDALSWHLESGVFEAVTYLRPWGCTVTGDGPAEERAAENVSPEFFEVFAMPPLLGRTLHEEDWKSDGRLTVLSHRYWMSRFGGDPLAVGQTLRIDGNTYEIVGVMPRNFREDNGVDFWLPRLLDERLRTSRGNRHSYALGRIKAGIPLSDAQIAVDRVAARLSKEFPESNTGRGVFLEPLHQSFVYDIRFALWLLFGAVGCVLLIACANVANLLLSRGLTREREFAIRSSLGGSRRRLLQQVLGESTLLSVLGGILGIAVAYAGVRLLLTVAPSDVQRLNETSVNLTALSFSLILSLLVGLLTGVLPALRAARAHPAQALSEDGRSASTGKRSSRLRSGLVIAEVSIALVLLVGAGLLVKSFVRLTTQPLGFETDGLVVTGVGLPGRYDSTEKRVRAYEAIRDAFQTIPGVSKSAIGIVPSRTGVGISIELEGRPVDLENELTCSFNVVGGGFFDAISVPLVRGRTFAPTDDENAPGVTIINQTLAKRYFGNEDPLGKRIRLEWEDEWRTVIGIARDFRRRGQHRPPKPDLFTHHAQMSYWGTAYLIRQSLPFGTLERQLREAAAGIDPELALRPIVPFEEILEKSSSEARFQTTLLTALAVLALFLTVIGIYGLITFLVRQRRKELEIRMALGAGWRELCRLVLTRGVGLTAIGIVIGLTSAFFLSRLLRSMLFEVSPLDPIVFLGVPLTLLLVATMASLIPIRRLTSAGPAGALRE